MLEERVKMSMLFIGVYNKRLQTGFYEYIYSPLDCFIIKGPYFMSVRILFHSVKSF